MSMSDHLVKHSVWQCQWSPNVDIMYGSVWSPYDGIVYDNVCCHLIFFKHWHKICCHKDTKHCHVLCRHKDTKHWHKICCHKDTKHCHVLCCHKVCCHLIFLILFSSFGSCLIAVFRIYRLFYHQLVPCFIGNKPCSHAMATIISI
jgi:hypothetical protein